MTMTTTTGMTEAATTVCSDMICKAVCPDVVCKCGIAAGQVLNSQLPKQGPG